MVIMIDIKNEKILTSQLALGMFVSELDRPWIETDFLFQGFLLEDQADLDKMVAICAHVYIDRTRSIGSQFAEEKRTKEAVPRRATVRMKPTILEGKKQQPLTRLGEKVSFIDILREVRNYKAPKDAANTSYSADLDHNVMNASQTQRSGTNKPQTESHNKEIKSSQYTGGIVNQLSSFIVGLFKRDRFKASHTKTVQEVFQHDLSDEERIIYELEPSVEEEMANIYPIFEQSEIVTRDIFNAIANEHQIDINSVSDVLDDMVESIGRTPDALLWLAKLKKVDGHSYNIALNVSVTLMAFSSFLALPKEQVKLAGFAGLLQDVGKVNLASDVLLKKGKLTKKEYRHAQTHVNKSLAILKKTPNIPPEVIRLVAEHHERFNGSGYPSKLKGDELSLLSQSTGLIDTYCAITNNRCYAEGAYHQQALDQIHALSGKLFSSEIIDQLIQFMGIYPVSSLVELNTGEVAVVIQQNQVRRLMPRVMLLLDCNKERYSSPIVLDLIYQPTAPNGEVYCIRKGIPADSYGLNPTEFYL
jgi:HD-GYP domain-containing protein (c-di-GMP phosphodiesterase class II)